MVVEYLPAFYMIPVISKVESYDIFMDRVKQSIHSAFSAIVIPAQAGMTEWAGLHFECRICRVRYFAFHCEME